MSIYLSGKELRKGANMMNQMNAAIKMASPEVFCRIAYLAKCQSY